MRHVPITSCWSAIWRRSQTGIAVISVVLGSHSLFAAPTETSTARPLDLRGNQTVLEMAPVLVALDRHPRSATFRAGGIADLFVASDPPETKKAPDRAVTAQASLAELANNAETQALRSSVAHPDLRIILTISEGLYRVIGRRSVGITHLADLRGKRVGTIPHTSAAYFLHTMLASIGSSENDITVVPLKPGTFADALSKGQVDAIAAWEPEAAVAKIAIGQDAIEFSDPKVYRELFNLNTTAGALADPEKRQRIVAFVRQLVTASQDVNRDPRLAQTLLAKHTGVSKDLIAAAFPHHRFPAMLPRDMLDVMHREEVWLAHEAHREARTRSELKSLIDGSVLTEALAKP